MKESIPHDVLSDYLQDLIADRQLVAADAARQLQMARVAQARLSAQQRVSQQQPTTTVVGVSAIAPAADTVVAPPPTHSNVANIAMSQL
jgi:hypothetical protein